MIRYSSFNYVALLHSLLANVSEHQSREWGTIAAVARWRPPWFVVFYRSMHVFCVDLYDKHFHVAKLGLSQFLPPVASVWTCKRSHDGAAAGTLMVVVLLPLSTPCCHRAARLCATSPRRRAARPRRHAACCPAAPCHVVPFVVVPHVAVVLPPVTLLPLAVVVPPIAIVVPPVALPPLSIVVPPVAVVVPPDALLPLTGSRG